VGAAAHVGENIRGGRPRCSWVDDINMDIKEIGWEGVQRVYMAQDSGKWRAVAIARITLLVPQHVGID